MSFCVILFDNSASCEICVFIGRDIHSHQHGGTWLGISREGKFSTVTNVRAQYGQPTPAPKSRGMH